MAFVYYFLRKVSWIIGESFLAVSTLVSIDSSRLGTCSLSSENFWTPVNKPDNVNVIYFIHFHAHFSSKEGREGNRPRMTWNTSRSTTISDSSAGPTPRQNHARSEMQSLHLVVGRPLDRFPVGLASRTCLASLSLGILDKWPNPRNYDLSIWRSGSTFRALRFSQLRSLSRSVTPGVKRGRQVGQNALGAEKSQQCLSFCLQYSAFTPKRPSVQTWERQTCFLPRAQSNLGTTLCHTVVFAKIPTLTLVPIMSVITQDSWP